MINPLIAFYLSSGTDRAGRSHGDIVSFSDEMLEKDHTYIQWLFPLFEKSQFNPDAPTLDGEVVSAFLLNKDMQTAFLASYCRMMAFYRLVSYSVSRNWRKTEALDKKPWWLRKGDHNFRRLTRIMTSLRILGFATESQSLFDCLRGLYEANKDCIGQETFDFWQASQLSHVSNSKEVLYSGNFLKLSRIGRWEFAERTNDIGAVAIIAITNDDQLVLVSQQREPLGCKVIELPAGLVGDINQEAPEESAKRELLEETGYSCENMNIIGDGPTSPGLTNELVTFAIADGLKKAAPGGGIDGENISVHLIPIQEASEWLETMRLQLKIDWKVYAGLYFAERHRKRGK